MFYIIRFLDFAERRMITYFDIFDEINIKSG